MNVKRVLLYCLIGVICLSIFSQQSYINTNIEHIVNGMSTNMAGVTVALSNIKNSVLAVKKLQDDLIFITLALYKNTDFKPDYNKVKLATVIVRSGDAGGTGTVIKIDENYLYVLTAKHVTVFTGKLSIKLVNIKTGDFVTIKDIDRKLVFEDKKVDMSIIKVPRPKGEYVSLNIAQNKPKLGDKTYAIGHPLSIYYTLSVGVVANYDTEVCGRGKYHYMMISNPVFSGSSGGSVVNANSEVTGIVVAMLSLNMKRTKMILNNFTFAVSLDHIQRFVKELKI